MINSNIIQAGNAYIASHLKGHSPLTGHKHARPFITISRESGAGAAKVGEKLIDFLNEKDVYSENSWALFDKNLIAKVIEEHHLPGVFKNYLTEQKYSEVQNTFESLMGLHPGISKLAAKTCSTIIHLASLGNTVIIGRGANILTKNMPGGFHVRLIADMDWKLAQIEKNLNKNKKEAAKFIGEEDLRRKEYVKKLFNKNVEDPLMYDLIVKTSSIPFSEAAEIIGGNVIRYLKQHMLSAA
jgi:cytidylate kinase